MIPVYIGYDHVEEGAFWTCASSILRHASEPVQIIPLKRTQLPITRPRHPKQSNEFAFTRWLVPYLQNYSGYGIFIDCDFLFFGDIAELWYLRNPDYAVQVCKHSGETFEEGKKFLNRDQLVYNKKCWSSLMLFNCEHIDVQTHLKPELINEADGLFLHQFSWTDDTQIGSLPLEWNWLVGHYPDNQGHDVKAVHFTEGGPYFKDYAECAYADEFWEAFKYMKHVQEGLT